MVDVRGFRAIRYTESAGDAEELVTQPYDKIDAAMQQEYYSKSLYNYCRIILPMEPNKYEVASQRILDWLRKNILTKDDAPSVFVCRQEFTLDGHTRVRTGVIVALRLYDYSENVVYPHEITFSAPKADRLNMLRTVQKDLEPSFLTYSDPEKVTIRLFEAVSKTKPMAVVRDSFGVKHTVWRVADAEQIKLLRKTLEPKTVVIIDGHHRYESALAYRNEKRKEKRWDADAAFNFKMVLLVPLEDQGMVVLPSHRLLIKIDLTEEGLNALRRFFSVSEIEPTVAGLDGFLKAHRNEHAFAVYTRGKAYGLDLRDREGVYESLGAKSSKETEVYDVVILHDFILKAVLKTGELEMDEDILYERWTKDAVEKVDRGEAKVAFLVNPINVGTVWKIAHEHKSMPHKTTDFYPKPVSGLVMMDIADGEKLT